MVHTAPWSNQEKSSGGQTNPPELTLSGAQEVTIPPGQCRTMPILLRGGNTMRHVSLYASFADCGIYGAACFSVCSPISYASRVGIPRALFKTSYFVNENKLFRWAKQVNLKDKTSCFPQRNNLFSQAPCYRLKRKRTFSNPFPFSPRKGSPSISLSASCNHRGKYWRFERILYAGSG